MRFCTRTVADGCVLLWCFGAGGAWVSYVLLPELSTMTSSAG